MTEHLVERGVRAIRIRSNLTQRELAIAARVPRSVVQAIETGRLERVRVGDVRAVAAALDASAELSLRWRGGDLPRLVNGRHALLHEAVAARFASLAAWAYEPEVSFSRFGERGVVDGLGWHADTRSLLVLELKSQLVDINELMGSVDRKRRLAGEIVAERGWRPAAVSTWVVATDTRTNHRALARHAAVLRAKFPADGHALAAWLRRPNGRLDAFGFLTVASTDGRAVSSTATRLVRRARDPHPEP